MEKEKMKCEGENKGEDEVAAREEWTSDSYGQVTVHSYIKWVKDILAFSPGVLGAQSNTQGLGFKTGIKKANGPIDCKFAWDFFPA